MDGRRRGLHLFSGNVELGGARKPLPSVSAYRRAPWRSPFRRLPTGGTSLHGWQPRASRGSLGRIWDRTLAISRTTSSPSSSSASLVSSTASSEQSPLAAPSGPWASGVTPPGRRRSPRTDRAHACRAPCRRDVVCMAGRSADALHGRSRRSGGGMGGHCTRSHHNARLGTAAPKALTTMSRSRRSGMVGDPSTAPPASQRDDRPDKLDDAERPRPAQETVRTRQQTPGGKGEYESGPSVLQCVHGHHEGESRDSE